MILDSGSRPSKKENIDLLYPTIRLEKTGPNLSGVSLQFPHRICSKSLQFPPPICSGRKKTKRKAKGNRRRIRKALSHEVANTAPDIQVDRPPSGAALKNGKGGGAEAVVAMISAAIFMNQNATATAREECFSLQEFARTRRQKSSGC